MKTIQSLLIALLTGVLAPSAFADDHGNTLATATTISGPDTPGNLENTTDDDWFKLVVTVPGRHWIYTTGSTDTYATFYDGAGVQITYDDNGGTYYNIEDTRILSAGTYYIRISGGYTVANTGAYKLHVRSPQNATTFTGPNSTANLGVVGEIDLYRITTASAGRNWIYSTGGAADTYAILFDSTGNQVTYDDNGGNGYNFLFDRLFQANQTYYLLVRGGSSLQTGDYTLSWRNYANSILASATTQPASLAVDGDIDLFQFDINKSGRCWIYSTGNIDTYAVLYDSAGNQVIYDNNGGSGYNFMIERLLAPGRYWLLVTAGSTPSMTGDYTLNLRQPSTATPILSPGSTARSLDPFGDLDLFAFSTSGGSVTLSSSGSTDTYATLFDNAGNQVIYDSNGGADLNFSITRTLSAGSYYLLVSGGSLDLSSGSYLLNASFPAGSGISSISASSSLVVGTGSAVVQISASGSWSVSGLPSWATASQASGTGGASITFTLAPNLTGSRREATVMIGGIPHTILQNPAASTAGTIPQPSLAIFPAVILAIETVNGAHYRIETSNDLIHWEDTGVEFIGNGAEMSSAVERTQAKAYFRAAVN